MSVTTRTTTVAGLLVSGLAFAAYPALRPYGPETGMAGAADFGDDRVARRPRARHGRLRLPWPSRCGRRPTGRPGRGPATRSARRRPGCGSPSCCCCPTTAREAYGLHELGSLRHGTVTPPCLDVADAFRYAPFEMTTFALGLLALVLVGGRLAHGLWRSGRLGRTAGILAGLGLATYLPQFFGTPEVRIVAWRAARARPGADGRRRDRTGRRRR